MTTTDLSAAWVEKFWAKVDRRSDDECWPWLGYIQTGGYGACRIDGTYWLAHRLSHTLAVGPIPEGLTIDHLCSNKPCVNPSHLEPVTMRVNNLRSTGVAASNARKTHCNAGHEFTPTNTYVTVRRDGRHRRQCRECCRLRMARRRKEASNA